MQLAVDLGGLGPTGARMGLFTPILSLGWQPSRHTIILVCFGWKANIMYPS